MFIEETEVKTNRKAIVSFLAAAVVVAMLGLAACQPKGSKATATSTSPAILGATADPTVTAAPSWSR